MKEQDLVKTDWLAVVAKCLATLCLANVAEKNATLADKAYLLENLGLNRKDVAAMLDTTPASVAELLRLKRNKKGAKKRGTKKS